MRPYSAVCRSLIYTLSLFFLNLSWSMACCAEVYNSCDNTERYIQIILKAIRSAEAKPILSLIDSGVGIAWGGDGVRSYGDVRKDLFSKSGPLYCRLFGCKGGKEPSIRSQLTKVDDKTLKVSCAVYMKSKDKMTTWVQVDLDWPGKTEDDALGAFHLRLFNSHVYIEELFTD